MNLKKSLTLFKIIISYELLIMSELNYLKVMPEAALRTY